MNKRVAIIGGGPSGLNAAKCVLEHDIEPVVFEKENSPGGLWGSGFTSKTAMWDGLHANVTTFYMSFSDYSFPKGCSLLPSSKEVYKYLIGYMEHFGISKYIRLNTIVNRAKQLENKKWQIESTNVQTNETKCEIFDFLIVTTGLYSKPRIPVIENSENFNGLILHSSDFKLNDERLKSKKVIVVGISHSGSDIAGFLVDHAKCVINLFRRPYLVAPRLVKFKSYNSNLEKNEFNIWPLDFFGFNRSFGYKNFANEEERLKFKISHFSKINPEQTNKEKSHPELYFDLSTEDLRVCNSDNYYPLVKRGKIIPKRGQIKKFETNGVYLEDGSFETADVVLFCTGYKLSLDFFDENILKSLNYDQENYRLSCFLYKFTFPPNIENLAMVYMVNGLTIISTEQQNIFASLVFSGKIKLPSKEEMNEETKLMVEKANKNKNSVFPYGPRIKMIDSIPAAFGSLPDFDSIKNTDPELHDLIWNNCMLAEHYSLKRNNNNKQILKLSYDAKYLCEYKYKFDNDDETSVDSIKKIAEKFCENNLYKIETHTIRV